jgi:hypothetical protein
MSLIHDALKRAKVAEKQPVPPDSPGPAFRAVEPGQYARRGIGIALPVALGVVALLGLFLVWRFAQNGVRARSSDTPSHAAVAEPAKPTTPLATDAPAPKPMAAVAPSTPVPAVATPPTEAVTVMLTNSAADTATNIATSTAAPAEPTPPKPAPLRLQALFFHPQHPSAVVSGKTLFLGDRIGDLRLVAVDKESVTLAGGGKTNVLTLDQ